MTRRWRARPTSGKQIRIVDPRCAIVCNPVQFPADGAHGRSVQPSSATVAVDLRKR